MNLRLAVLVVMMGLPPITGFTVDAQAQPAPESPPHDGPVLDVQDVESRVRAAWRPVAEAAHKRLQADPTDAIAWGELSRALEHGGKPYAALLAWRTGHHHAPEAVAPLLPRALELADNLDEDVWLGGVLRNAFGLPMDAPTRERLALFVARHHFRRGAWGEASSLLPLISRNGPYALEAQVLQGTLLAQQSRYTEALPAMLTAYERSRQAGRPPRYVSTLAMNAARTLFATKAWEQAIGYYQQVPPADPSWPRAQVEMAWAAFRAQDMNRTLGLLQTHESPFFDDFYQPEAQMLRAQALYLLCKFPATTAAIDAFQARYQPILDTLHAQLDTWTADQVLADAQRERAGEPTQLPRMLLREVVWDGRLDRQLNTLRESRHELKGLDWVPLVRDALQARHDEVQAETGARLLAHLQAKQEELRDLLSNIELTRVDLLSLEAELYQRAAATGKREPPAARIESRKALRRKGLRVWPFQGESWVDELGAYTVQTPSECPESLSRGR